MNARAFRSVTSHTVGRPLSIAQQATVRWYVTTPGLNNKLRMGRSTITRDERLAVQHLDAAMRPLGRATTVFRAVPRELFAYLTVRDAFVDRGFVSTSQTPEALVDILGWAHLWGVWDVTTLMIHVPAGTRGLDVNVAVSEPPLPWQQEFILARGLSYVVLERTRTTIRLWVDHG